MNNIQPLYWYQRHPFFFWGCLVLTGFFVGFFSGHEARDVQITKTCLVQRTDLGALSNDRLDSRIQTLHDALEYTITVRMTRSMDERDQLEAERTGLEVQLDEMQ